MTVYSVGVTAAVRLLPRRSRPSAMVTLAAVVVLLMISGPHLLWPLGVTGGVLLYLRLKRRVSA